MGTQCEHSANTVRKSRARPLVVHSHTFDQTAPRFRALTRLEHPAENDRVYTVSELFRTQPNRINAMNTRQLKLLLLILFVLPTFANTALVVRAADKPNFVWLVSEDNSKHYLRLFDEHGIETPNIEKLAKHGLIFDHAFSNAPVCSTARTTLATCCDGPRIGTQFHRCSTVVPMPDGLKMFPQYLREAGWYTTNNDKKDYNAVEGKIWNESSTQATWRNRETDQPFFHMQTFKNSHESRLHFSRNDYETIKTTTDPETVFVAPNHPDTPLFRYTNAYYRDRIQLIDAEIGAVVDQLEQDGLLEDTFVFYFGDHGGVLPGSKGYTYESGLHVPLVVRIPQKFKHLVDAEINSHIKGFVSFVDFGPTLLELAGIEIPAQVDGKPFLGKSISLDELNSRDEAFGYADRFDEKYDLVRTLRNGRFKYMRSYQPFNFDGLQNNYRYIMLAYQEWREMFVRGELNEVQSQFFLPRAAEALYDLEADPYETKNLADDPKHREKLMELRGKLTAWVKGMPDLSMYPEDYLVAHAFDNPVAFGQAHKTEIAELVDIADLSLAPIDQAAEKIEAALESENPWKRYWGLIACSSHGQAASSFYEKAKTIAASDPELQVRIRAAEFLGITGAANPVPIIEAALQKAASRTEASLMMNTLVLLRDGPFGESKSGYTFHVDPAWFDSGDGKRPGKKVQDDLQRRIDYLTGEN